MEVNNYKIAVIIPAYNCEDTIGAVLDSIVNQTAVELIGKIVVVNDGSTDNTQNTVEEFIQKTQVPILLINKENGGVSSARNLGMETATEENWFAFCDSDDTWNKDKLEKQITVLKQNPAIDCLGGLFGNNDLRINGKIVKKLIKGTVKDICIQNFPQPSTVIMKRKIYDELGGFDENQKYAEDGAYFLNVAYHYNLFYSPDKLIEFGFGKRGFGNTGLSGNMKGMYEGNKKNLKSLYKKRMIGRGFYIEMRMLFALKYLRRKLLVFLGRV